MTLVITGAIAVLGGIIALLTKSNSNLRSNLKVQTLMKEDCFARWKAYKDINKKNEEIDSEPISNSVSNALSSMPTRGEKD
jgi:hypothetical protein